MLFGWSDYTYDVKNNKRVLAASASSEKAHITVVLATTAAGDILVLQVIFQGKTDRCHPVDAADTTDDYGWNITHSASHWSTAETMEEYVDKVLVPFAAKKRQDLHLPVDHPAVTILDLWTVHRTDDFINLLKSRNFLPVFVPGGLTGEHQPQDVSFNRPFKAELGRQFERWFMNLSAEERRNAGKLSVLKGHILTWVYSALEYCGCYIDKTVLAGWRRAGLMPAVTPRSELQLQAKVLFPDINTITKPPTREEMAAAKSDASLSNLEIGEEIDEVIEEGEIIHIVVHPAAAAVAGADADSDAVIDADVDGEVELVVSSVRSVSLNPVVEKAADAADAADNAADDDGEDDLEEIVVV